MLIKILGGIDLLGGLILLFAGTINFNEFIFGICGAVFIIKSFLGRGKDFASWIDFFAGVLLIILIFSQIHWVISIVIGILLIQKGIFSLIG